MATIPPCAKLTASWAQAFPPFPASPAALNSKPAVTGHVIKIVPRENIPCRYDPVSGTATQGTTMGYGFPGEGLDAIAGGEGLDASAGARQRQGGGEWCTSVRRPGDRESSCGKQERRLAAALWRARH